MKKFAKIISVVGLAVSLLVAGCVTLTTDKVKAIAVVVQQTSQQAATYAIQQDVRNAAYFKLASAGIDHFVVGNDLSPTAFQNALMTVPGVNANQWVSLGVSAVVITYDIAYSQYVIGQVNSQTNAVILLNAVNNGFKVATGQTNVVPLLARQAPDFLKGGVVDKELLRARVTAARK